MKKKLLSFLLLTSLCVSSFNTVTAKAATINDDTLNLLVQNGYTIETAEALPEDTRNEIAENLLNNPDLVDISTTFLEVDTLSEVESFVSHTDEELIDMGADKTNISANRNEINKMINMTDKDLREKYNYDDLEIKLFKKAVENGQNIKNGKMKKPSKADTSVNASGTIASSKLSFTQTRTNYSSSTAPNYRIENSFSWITPFQLSLFNDTIVVAWGGGLNLDNYATLGNAKYYAPNNNLSAWTDKLLTTTAMSKDQTVQKGIKFNFHQAAQGRVRNGYSTATIYQTKFQGYDTNVVSMYAHRLLQPNASISISASGASVSISASSSYDTSSQRSSTIRY